MYYRGGKVSWGTYLLDQSLNDVKQSINKGHRNIHDALVRQEQNFAISADKIEHALSGGFDSLQSGLDSVRTSIEGFHADFNYGMSILIDQVEFLNENFKDLLAKLDHIHETIKHPLLTKAAELREIGFDRLTKGLLDKSLESFLKSDEIYDTDFIVNLQIGKLYLYGKDEGVDLIDLEKAKKYLLNAARYAKAEIRQLPEAKHKATEAYFHASLTCYVLANEIYTKNSKNSNLISALTNEAYDLADEAVKLSPKFDQALYHKAKYSALLGNNTEMLGNLKAAIFCDKKYAIAVYADEDFTQFKKHIDDLIRSLRDSAKSKFETLIKSFDEALDRAKAWDLSGSEIGRIKARIVDAKYHYSKDTYIEIDEAIHVLNDELYSKLTMLVQDEIKKWQDNESRLFATARDYIRKLEYPHYKKYINLPELHKHKQKIEETKPAAESLKSIKNTISILNSEISWLKGQYEIAAAKHSKKRTQRDTIIQILQITSGIAGHILAIAGPLVGLILLSKYYVQFGLQPDSIKTLYAGSGIVFICFLFAAIFLSLSQRAETLTSLLPILGVCAITPILLYVLTIVVLIALVIILLIPMLFGIVSMDGLFDWLDNNLYFVVGVICWLVSLFLFYVEFSSRD